MDALALKWEEGLGVVSGLIEQVRVALDQIDFCGDSFGKDLHIPYQAKSLIGGLAFVTECLDCVERADNNEVKLIMCPAKYASAATDFLEGLDNMLGTDNANFWKTTSTDGDGGATQAPSSGWSSSSSSSSSATPSWSPSPAPPPYNA